MFAYPKIGFKCNLTDQGDFVTDNISSINPVLSPTLFKYNKIIYTDTCYVPGSVAINETLSAFALAPNTRA